MKTPTHITFEVSLLYEVGAGPFRRMVRFADYLKELKRTNPWPRPPRRRPQFARPRDLID